MKLCKCVATLALACFGVPSIVAIGEQNRALRSIFGTERLECTLFNVNSMAKKPEHRAQRLNCMTDDRISYRVDNVPDDFFEYTSLISSVTRISVLTYAVSQTNFTIDVAEGNGEIINSQSSDTKSYRNNGKDTRTLLVVRVFDSNGDGPTVTKEFLSSKVFGTGGSDKYNLVSGYDTCSGGKTKFAPASYTAATNGVMDLSLEQPIDPSTDNAYLVEFLANDALYSLSDWDWDAIDHIMYVLSNDISFEGAAAFAYIGGWVSVFDEIYADTYLLLMHEIGHNLGHHHSGIDDDEYADPTCWMGAHTYMDEGPDACFNAAKSWYFGWYNSNSKEIDPQNANANLNLIGINDYLNGEASSEDITVVKINGDSETLFMLYNKQEGINSGTAGYENDVTIVHQPWDGAISWVRAALDVGQKYEATNFRNGKKLVVEVCEKVSGKPDIARTIVYLDTINNISCGTSDNTPSPQASPTLSPQTFPQGSPTIPPQQSLSPQESPTIPPQQSLSPQESPTISPQQSLTPIFDDDSNCMDEDLFLENYNKKKEKMVLKACSWLEKKTGKVEKYCTKKWRYMIDDGTGVVYKPPHDACPSLCHFCSTYNEAPNFKFFYKYKGNSSKLKNCKWLEKRNTNTKNKVCSAQATDGVYPSADVICPMTCLGFSSND